jgi:hypothetical protein
VLRSRFSSALAIVALTQVVACSAGGATGQRSIAALPRLPASTIAALPRLSASTAVLSTGHLLALYSFNQTLNDSSGNGLNATDSGTPTYVPGAPFGGDAIKFDGTGSAIVTAPLNITVANLPQVTIGGWFKASSISTPQYGVVSNDDGNFDRTLDIDNRDGGIHWSAFIGGGVVGKVPVRTGQWIFMAVAYNQATLPGKFAFYVHNKSGMHTILGTDNFDTDSVSTGVTIGRNPNFDQPFSGFAANVFFYDGILTKAQIDNIIATGPSAIP